MGGKDDVGHGGIVVAEGHEAPPGPLQRMQAAGFQYPVFISWPHQMSSRRADLVVALARALEDRFKDEGGAEVLLDKERLKLGTYWNPALRLGLCRSAVTIVFLVPTYFRSEYCCLEWGISDALRKIRIPASSLRSTIIPIRLDRNVVLPLEVQAVEHSNEFLEVLAAGKDVTTHERWGTLVDQITDEIYALIDIVCHAPRQWNTEEELAREAKPHRFTWSIRPAAGQNAGAVSGTMQTASAFPRIVVEKPAA